MRFQNEKKVLDHSTFKKGFPSSIILKLTKNVKLQILDMLYIPGTYECRAWNTDYAGNNTATIIVQDPGTLLYCHVIGI